jgi:hypothetical protein
MRCPTRIAPDWCAYRHRTAARCTPISHVISTPELSNDLNVPSGIPRHAFCSARRAGKVGQSRRSSPGFPYGQTRKRAPCSPRPERSFSECAHFICQRFGLASPTLFWSTLKRPRYSRMQSCEARPRSCSNWYHDGRMRSGADRPLATFTRPAKRGSPRDTYCLPASPHTGTRGVAGSSSLSDLADHMTHRV